MEYVKVESSQIDSVGFGEGKYGPETLGIRFKSRSGITEYHYGNVTTRMHQSMMEAKSIGAYFGQNIKAFPEQFPYTKVESDHTLSDSEAQTTINGPDDDTPSTGTALALIDTMADDLLFTPGAVTDEQLENGRQWYLTEAKKYNITTEKSRKELKRFARSLQKLRTGIEARAKELTGATKRKIAAIDAEKRRLVQSVGGIEDEVLAPLTEWEQEEEQRTIRLSNRIKAIDTKREFTSETSVASLEADIAELESFDLSTMQEFKVSAESNLTSVLKVLRSELERRKVAEAEKAELERLRAESQARAEADRIEAAAKKLIAERDQAKEEAAKVETRKEVIAELESENHNDPESDGNQGHGEPEKENEPLDVSDELHAVLTEPRTIEQSIEPAEYSEEPENDSRLTEIVTTMPSNLREQGRRTESIYALAYECQIAEPVAYVVIDAIAKGLIPHITFEA